MRAGPFGPPGSEAVASRCRPPGARRASRPSSVTVEGATRSSRSSGEPSAPCRTPSSPTSTEDVTGGNGTVRGAMRMASSMARFQKIVRAVAVQSRSPVKSNVAPPHARVVEPSGRRRARPDQRCSCADAVGDPPTGVDGEERQTDGDGDGRRPREAPRHEQDEGTGCERRQRREPPGPHRARAPARTAGVGVFGSVSGPAICPMGTSAAAATMASHTGTTTRSARGAPREIHAQSPITSRGSAVIR